jgi:carbonic anhydrase
MSEPINPEFQPGFDDLWRANEDYVKSFKYSELTGRAARGLAIVTCMDSRINPLSVVGMKSGDAKILRNAGARVTQDVLRTLVLATYLLGVDRILVMPHTDCRMAQEDEEVIHAMIEEKHGVDTRSLE